jgi:O-antigen/teichoic acid export membrane protein
LISNRKNYLRTLCTGFGGTFFTMIIGFVSLPISLHYWDVEKYGLWALIGSIITYLGMSNLGLTSSASVLMGKCPSLKIKVIILKRTFKILFLIVLMLTSLFIFINFFYRDWIYILGKIPAHLSSQAYTACFILTLSFLISIPFGLSTSVFQGFQKVYIDNVFNLIQSLINFIGLLLVVVIKGDLITFAIITGSFTFLLGGFKSLYCYLKVIKPAMTVQDDNIECRDDISYTGIIRTGLNFFMIAIASLVVWNTDYLVISHFISVDKVTPYSVTFKLFQIIFGIVFIINNSMLPLFAKEFGKENWQWIGLMYKNLLTIMAIIGGGLWIGGIIFLKGIIFLWAGPQGFAGMLTVFSFGAYAYLLGMVSLNAGLITVFNYINRMPIISWAEAFCKFGCSVILLKFWNIGGVAAGTALGSLLSVTWILPLLLIKRSNGRIAYDIQFILKHFFVAIIPFVIFSCLLQIHVNNQVLMLSIGCVLFLGYFLVSYFTVSIEVKKYINEKMFLLLPQQIRPHFIFLRQS